MYCFYFLVEFTDSSITRKAVENPNNLEADLPNKRFKCISNIEVIIDSFSNKSIGLSLLSAFELNISRKQLTRGLIQKISCFRVEVDETCHRSS